MREQNQRKKEANKRRGAKQPSKRAGFLLVLAADIILLAGVLTAGGLLLLRRYQERNRPVLAQIQAPEWYTQDFLEKNPYSRPEIKRTQVRDIVIHYVANPGTSAMQNRNYFNGLATQTGAEKVSASSHYIIGIDGTIIQCIPLDEVAYANYPRNEDTVSIECCHPDASGEFTEATKASLVKLTAWLCGQLKLGEKHVIRHYDVSGKDCPKYYVDHEDAWKELRAEIGEAVRGEGRQ